MNKLQINEEDIELALVSTQIFSHINRDLLKSIISERKIEVYEYLRGEIIYSPCEYEKNIIIISSGNAAVYSADESRNMRLRSLRAGSISGVANFFTSEEYVSRIIAAEKTTVIKISENIIKKLLEQDKDFMYSYLAFMSDRICYLNRKIVILSAGSAERRLSQFLVDEADENLRIYPFSAKHAANMLNLGRASLYRALDKLCEDKLISHNQKEIIILDKNGLMSRYE